MKSKFTKILALVLSAAVLLPGLSSCQKDTEETGVQGVLGNGAISFGMAFETPSQDLTTKGNIELTDDEGNVVLMMGEEVFDTPSPEQTKAILINKTNFYTSFQVSGFRGEDAYSGITNLTVTKQSTKYPDGEHEQWTLGSSKLWPFNTNLEFFAWAPADAWTTVPTFTTVAEGTPAASFDYTVVDALTQKDILLARYYGNGADNKLGGTDAPVNGVATMKFSHALSSVKFKAAEDLTGFTINSIKLEGIGQTASCKATFGASETTYAWAAPTATADYTKTFTPAIEPSALETSLETFIVIPQTFGSSSTARIVLNITQGDKTFDVSYKLYDATRSEDKQSTTWEPGYTQTYRIGIYFEEYEFKLTKEEQSSQVYINTVNDSDVTEVPVKSNKIKGGHSTYQNWDIKSYTIEGETTEVDGTSFNAGGLKVEKNGYNLNVTALRRTPVDQGTHGYWVNNTSRTDYLDWSPDDWSTSKATTSSPMDLSKFDFKNESTRGTMTTANCYIVRHAGTYKIPLVYGNGVVDGNVNTKSYAPTLSGNTQPLTPFVNYLNEGISSPFIENNSNCVPTGCAILWQDEEVVVKDLSIVGDVKSSYDVSNVRYMKFTVDPSKVRQNNAVICIYKDLNENSEYDSGEAIWSWLIWTTNNPGLISDAIPVTNHAGYVYNFFPICNLGYIDGINYLERKTVVVTLEQEETGNTIDITVNQPVVIGQFTGNYYQFGRKDPMCRKNTPASGNFYIKDASLYDIYVNKAISEPDTFYGCGIYEQYSKWFTWAWPHSNLWSGSKATYNMSYENDSEIFKTIYDPSPVGYKVPASKAFTGFTTTGAGTDTPSEYNIRSFINGYYFYTDSTKSDVILFPASGYRQSETGAITDAGGRGSYWSAISGNESSGYQLLFYHGDGSGIAPDCFERRANGQSVRPVKE